jgi:hypothetical protein
MSCEFVHKHLCTHNAKIIIILWQINKVIAGFENGKESHLHKNNDTFNG